MTRQRNYSERADMSDQREAQAGEIFETRELWIVRFREDETHPWKDVGTERADAAATLRTYDYWGEHHADVERVIARVVVRTEVYDPEKLREELAQETAVKAVSNLQSE